MKEFTPVRTEITPEEQRKFAVQNELRNRALQAGVKDGHVFGFISLTAAQHVDEFEAFLNELKIHNTGISVTTGTLPLQPLVLHAGINRIFSKELRKVKEDYSEDTQKTIRQSIHIMFPPIAEIKFSVRFAS